MKNENKIPQTLIDLANQEVQLRGGANSRCSSSAGSAIDNAIKAMESCVQSNKQAALNSPQFADWSNGVAAGYQGSIDILRKNTK